jgi:hypothetical protein
MSLRACPPQPPLKGKEKKNSKKHFRKRGAKGGSGKNEQSENKR